MFAWIVACAAACGGASDSATPPPASPTLTTLRVSVLPESIAVGQSATASVTGLDQNGAAIGVGAPTWSVSSTDVATVSASGVVTAIAPGRTMLLAAVSGRQGQAQVTVVAVPVSRVLITPGEVRVTRGASVQLAATALDFSGRTLADRPVTWASSDALTATVDGSGLITAVAPGVVTIVARAEAATTSAMVTVTAVPDSVAVVTVNPPSPILVVGDSVQLAAALLDAGGHLLLGRTVTWSISVVTGTRVATVSASGQVKALSPGTVVINAFGEGQHGSVTLIVKDDADPGIVVSFASPATGALVGDTLGVYVGVQSANPLMSVVATVGPLTVPLKLTHVGALGGAILWFGIFDLTDLPTGRYQLLVTATDGRGAHGVGTTQFQRDTRVGKGGSAPSVPHMK